MSKEISELLKEATKDILTPETLTAIQEAVDTKAQERAKQEVEKALTEQDEKHTQLLQKLMEKVDTDNTLKLQKLITKIDESYANKLVMVKEHFEKKLSTSEKQLTVEAKKYLGDLSNMIDAYINEAVNRVLPTEKLNEAVKVAQTQKQIAQIRNIVGVNENTKNPDIKEALIDGKRQIDESKAQLEKILTENEQLKSKLNAKEAELLIEQKVSKLPPSKRNYVRKNLRGKTVEFITENFENICNNFDSEEQTLLENTKASTTTTKVDAPVITEEVDSPEFEDKRVMSYVDGLK